MCLHLLRAFVPVRSRLLCWCRTGVYTFTAAYIITTGMDSGIMEKRKGGRGTNCPGNSILKSTGRDAQDKYEQEHGSGYRDESAYGPRFCLPEISLRLQVTVDGPGEGFAAFFLSHLPPCTGDYGDAGIAAKKPPGFSPPPYFASTGLTYMNYADYAFRRDELSISRLQWSVSSRIIDRSFPGMFLLNIP